MALIRADNLHSRLVFWLKIALPLVALALLATLFLFGRPIRPEDAIPYASTDITDRAKDVVKSGGEWISSVALENALMSHPAVLEAAVFAAKHPKWDERPIAAVVLKPGHTATREELIAHLAPVFPKFWLPDDVVFVAQVPRTSTGKFLKSKLREEYGDRLLGA